MAFFLTTLLRKGRLKKYSSRVPTGLLPLKDIRKALVVVDGTEPGCLGYADRMKAFLEGYKIETSLIYIDLRKISKDMQVFVAGEEVITRKDVTWYGMPRMKRKGLLFSGETDLLVNLRDSSDFTGDFISRTSGARFKIGSSAYPGNPFDLVVSGKSSGEEELPEEGSASASVEKRTRERVDAICNFLNQIV